MYKSIQYSEIVNNVHVIYIQVKCKVIYNVDLKRIGTIGLIDLIMRVLCPL